MYPIVPHLMNWLNVVLWSINNESPKSTIFTNLCFESMIILWGFKSRWIMFNSWSSLSPFKTYFNMKIFSFVDIIFCYFNILLKSWPPMNYKTKMKLELSSKNYSIPHKWSVLVNLNTLFSSNASFFVENPVSSTFGIIFMANDRFVNLLIPKYTFVKYYIPSRKFLILFAQPADIFH